MSYKTCRQLTAGAVIPEKGEAPVAAFILHWQNKAEECKKKKSYFEKSDSKNEKRYLFVVCKKFCPSSYNKFSI